MGPALIEPDHPGLGARVRGQVQAAMGPALIEPDHTKGSLCAQPGTRPQWGRLSSSRITEDTDALASRGRAGRRGHDCAGAAMGPALIEPDHADLLGWLLVGGGGGRNGAGSHRAGSPGRHRDRHGGAVHAAMGPALIEPDHADAFPSSDRMSGPQWGRLSSSRITTRRGSARARWRGRNGAGSHRTGSRTRPAGA